ncbi:flagellar FliJ family protein [Pseudooceanicola nanhaiensis]|uniref:flagellar FliJ family protein n=1 Tax=Pseudooceanicola nanhaiensis TaxID=375761 RepID=UPI001CD247BE|nr:flagellar FliJ family protein [Pseudooceanicola nanhaiensis]MCA0922601.1 flagellar FliJ family protein [Pseudooceanicola nanhaiensis]
MNSLESALLVMERLRRHEIEDELRELTLLRERMGRLEEQKRELNRRLRDETRITTIEAAPYVMNFVTSVREEILKIDREIDKLHPRFRKLEDKVAEVFREMKTYETVRIRNLRQRLKDIRQKEDREADEMTILRWNRD